MAAHFDDATTVIYKKYKISSLRVANLETFIICV